MGNKDFRDRLRNHEVPFNPEAWDQMNLMLDSLEGKKKKYFFLWWLFGAGLLLIGIYLISRNNNLRLSHSEPISSEVNMVTEKNTIASEDLNDASSKEDFESSNTHTEIILDSLGENVKNANRSSELNNNSNINAFSSSEENDPGNKNEEVGFNNSQELNSNQIKDKESQIKNTGNQAAVGKALDDKNLNTESNKADVTSSQSNTDEEKDLTTNKLTDSKQDNSIAKAEEETVETDLDNSSLSNQLANSNTNISQVLNPLEQIDFIISRKLENFPRVINPRKIEFRKPSKHAIFGQVGLAQFNENPGLYISSGVQFRINPLVYIETSLAYGYGKESNVEPDLPGTHEQQINLGVLTQLNLVNKDRHRFAFGVGFGLARYWGIRVVSKEPLIVDERSSQGLYFQGGLSYTYLINRNVQLGIQYGAVVYDDSIETLSFKLYKNF
ncbi:MAG: hypothetical protein HKN51_17485 [Saprospiraceae bacterium]|nr:hypothetical protein [Saprospiraceae bacterium]